MNLEIEASLIMYCNLVISFQEYSKHLCQIVYQFIKQISASFLILYHFVVLFI